MRKPFSFIKRKLYQCIFWYSLRKILGFNKSLLFNGSISGKKVFFMESEEILKHFEAATGCLLTQNIHDAEIALLWGVYFGRDRCQYLRLILKHKLPLITVEGGFVYSTRNDIASGFSFQVDHVGIYYDVSLGSSLIDLLNSEWTMTPEEIKETTITINLILKYKISKYNLVEPDVINFNPSDLYQSTVLVLDQRKYDRSISGANANAKSFQSMLVDAIDENPSSLILVKTHPDAISGGYMGYFNSLGFSKRNVKIISRHINPISLLESVDKVYTVSSQMGMEALLCGKKVICYGAPFYSGWGLTIDRGFQPKRERTRTNHELFCVGYMKYTYYSDPATGKKSCLRGVLKYLSDNAHKL